MDKDRCIIAHVLTHIEDIKATIQRFGDSFTTFAEDTDYFNSVAMSLLQIGELSRHLSPVFCEQNAEIPWKQIVGLRNIVVHGYGSLDKPTLWVTIHEDLPLLKQRCSAIMRLAD